MTQGKYNLLYRFFRAQIEFGYYRQGDCLPTMEQLHSVYGAALRTVRSAYRQLQDEGYVSLSSGRRTLVVWAGGPEECLARSQDYYLARQEGFRQLEEALVQVLPPLLRQGCSRLQRRELREIKSLTAWENGGFYIAFFSGRQMLRALHNDLLVELYDEIASYYQFPHVLYQRLAPGDMAPRLHEGVGQVTAACEREDRAALYRATVALQYLLSKSIRDYIGQAAAQRPPQPQKPFTWDIYGQRPQACYSLAARLVGRIAMGDEFAPGSALPSYRALAQAYGISFSTARRGVDLLESLGLAAAQHGVATQVTWPQTGPARLPGRTAQKLITMFAEVLQVLEMASDGILASFAGGWAQRSARCAAALGAPDSGFLPFFRCLGFLLYEAENPVLREILSKLYEALLLGLPLVEAAAKARPDPERQALNRELRAGIETADFGRFQEALRRLARLAAAAAAQLLPGGPGESALGESAPRAAEKPRE